MKRAGTGLGVAVTAVMTVLVLAFPAAAAAPVPAVSTATTGTSSTVWAYGALKTVSLSGKGVDATSPYAYTINAYYGWQVILTQTNISANVTELELNRTVGLTFYASYCRPNCASPYANENVTILYHESGAAFANVTDAATVTENGHAVPAFGLLNEAAQGRSSYVKNTTAVLKGLSGPKTYDWDEITSTNGTAQIAFTPPLGLFPQTPTNGSSWNSSAAFAATGGWGATGAYVANPIIGSPVDLEGSASGSVARNGTLALFGTDLGNVTLSDGSVVQALAISVLGPFTLREGVLLLPADADALPSGPGGGYGAPVSAPESYGNLTVTANAADFRAGGAGHFGLSASFAQFVGASTAPAASSTLSPAEVPATTAPAADGPGTVSVQAEPESVSQAQQGANCLSEGTCPLGSVAPSGLLHGAGLVLVAVLVVSLVVVAVVVDRRRQEPAPPRPSASPYRAAAPGGARPGPGAPRAPPSDSDADDPLGHLW